MTKIFGFFRKHWVLTGLLFLVIGVFAWLMHEYPEGSWRYKLTVTVETPDGLKTGSAVREITVKSGPSITPESHSIVEVKGEAVAVDLGQRGVLFVLLDQDDAAGIVYQLFPYQAKTPYEWFAYYKSLKGETRPLLPSQYPTMVTFKDITDPKSVMAVDRSDLSKTFGAGVKLKDITLEMTEEDVTWGIDNYLPWLAGRRDTPGALGGSPDKPFEDPTGLFLTGVEFSKGRFW